MGNSARAEHEAILEATLPKGKGGDTQDASVIGGRGGGSQGANDNWHYGVGGGGGSPAESEGVNRHFDGEHGTIDELNGHLDEDVISMADRDYVDAKTSEIRAQIEAQLAGVTSAISQLQSEISTSSAKLDAKLDAIQVRQEAEDKVLGERVVGVGARLAYPVDADTH